MADSGYSRAVIVNLDNNEERIPCMFNPKEYTFAKQNTWSAPKDPPAANMPQIEFSTGQPTTLQLQLFFDTYETKKDVRKEYTDAVWKLMLIDENLHDYSPKSGKGRPPRVRFQWGDSWSFEAVITSISQKFTLFLPQGTPVRATLDVSFQQLKDESLVPKQNPTSGGVGGERVWTVKDGDTLAWIAYKEYGDSNHWRAIATANRLARVRELTPGMVLVIPNE
jgi:nucleoid-associated protein YgaU